MRDLSAEAGQADADGRRHPADLCRGDSRRGALKHVNIPGLLAWANKAKFAVKPPSGRSRRSRTCPDS